MDDLKKNLEHNMEIVLDEDSAITITTQTSRSSRTSRSKGPSKSTILQNKQKEKKN
ncbi:13978_t:CDS:2 [Funneliformis caledonium]|uniref:13978_t:CDS:1 n=1 Tax=Funneliformis caledonium TaxID=1117310 RepID=A0A9N9ILF3_9GLOM|nr:13978_t:CDS:2 [Funneliformis caledonium]